ncbi:uracil-DNA glycosylase [Virgibacillus oceani]|uniref:Uracil-DNA glycosylase n=1 Tax=Virgibacillus oceani TaxID=1479511 RepID=A0A917HEP1_9BACI|nr:uracil-DNA glycosylase [Virgibacillus oceani]GGG76479.1 uracil-DNA glycosylase [Virgibacillus oceani]
MSNFCPVQWPEEATPNEWKACKECGLYKHGSRMIWGEGNPDAPIMIILDNPGAREDREGNPFVCGTRQTLQKAAHHVGLTSQDIYVTYILKRKPARAYEKEQTRKTCMIHLKEQLQVKNPALIFCMGNVSVQSFFHNAEVDVKSLRGKLHNVQGYQTAVAYHPLAVRRRPNLWTLFVKDWQYVADHYEKIRKG